METSTAVPGIPPKAQVFMLSVVAVGVTVCFAAAYYLPFDRLDWLFCSLAIATVFFGSRLSVKIPRSEVYFMMGDALIFLTFLRYGGEAAILLATVEALGFSLINKKQFPLSPNLIILFNGATIACATASAYAAALLYPTLSGKVTNYDNVVEFFTLLGMMALAQFIVNSFLAAWGTALITKNIKIQLTARQAWKEKCLTGAITIFAGAAAAGFVYRIIEYSNFLAAVVAVPVVGLIYWACSHFIGEMRNSYEQTERAERERAEAEYQRAETEQTRRQEIEQHVEELSRHIAEQDRISEALRQSKQRFQHNSLHDSLTGLPNRAHFCEQLKDKLKISDAEPSSQFAVLFLDLDRFKSINDNLGHAIGDELLINVGKRLGNVIRRDAGDMVARLGGDEYAVLLNDIFDPVAALSLAERIQGTLSQPFKLNGYQVVTAPSIGIAMSNGEYQEPEDVLRDADIAMYHAKDNKKGCEMFRPEMRTKAGSILEIETGLRSALVNDELRIHYQPIIALGAGRLVGFEALMRWEHPTRGLVSPAEFIPVAEESGLIIPMTLWIMREACEQLSRWQNINHDNQHLFVSVNLSSRNFAQPDLVEQVREILAETSLDAHHLKLEITESAVMVNIEETINVLKQLRELNVQLSIDDFGTGYSSLSYLHQFPVDTLKIDRSFINRIGENGEDSEIVRTIITLARSLDLEVIAEGIETIDQLNQLRLLGCRYAQGFLMSRPLPEAKISEVINQKQNWLPENVPLVKGSMDQVYYLSEKAINRYATEVFSYDTTN